MARRIYQLLCFEFEGFNFPFCHRFLCYFRQLKCRGLSYFRESIECIYMCWKNRSHESLTDGKYHTAAHASYWLTPWVAVNNTELTHLSLLLGEQQVKLLREGRPRAEGSSHHRHCRVIPVPSPRHNPTCGTTLRVSMSCGHVDQISGTDLRRCFPGVAAWWELPPWATTAVGVSAASDRAAQSSCAQAGQKRHFERCSEAQRGTERLLWQTLVSTESQSCLDWKRTLDPGVQT